MGLGLGFRVCGSGFGLFQAFGLEGLEFRVLQCASTAMLLWLWRMHAALPEKTQARKHEQSEVIQTRNPKP